MFTRRGVAHQYGDPGPEDQSAPPFHCVMHPHQYPAHVSEYGGGLRGGAVPLTVTGPMGIRRGNTGYGYLGMDPSDPLTWVVRPFAPSAGMIAYLNVAAP